MPDELLAELDEEAKKSFRSRSAVVRSLLRKALAARKGEQQCATCQRVREALQC